MLYSIAEVSDLIGLSKVSIYKKLKLKNFEGHFVKKQGITYVSEHGFNLIKESLKLKEEVKSELKPKEVEKGLNEDVSMNTEALNLKTDYINTLKEQLKEKDKQIIELVAALSKAQELHKNTQVLQLNQQKDIPLLEAHFMELDEKLSGIREEMEQRKINYYEEQEQKSFWKKFFKK